jgi:polyhydroxyalkanoate synthase
MKQPKPPRQDEEKVQTPFSYQALWWVEALEKTKHVVDQLVAASQKGDEEGASLGARTWPVNPALTRTNSYQPPTIFDPDIVRDVFSKACAHLTMQLEEKPQRFLEIQDTYRRKLQDLFDNTQQRLQGLPVQPVVTPHAQDKRFRDAAWEEEPYFDFLKQSYLLQAELLQNTARSLDGLDTKTHHKINFYTRCFVDAMAPTNFPSTNPLVLRETLETQGENLQQGFANFVRDFCEGDGQIRMTDASAFQIGKNLATTPGKVVFQNDIFQLIQYLPTTAEVAAVPLLIVPPWINKYYIFDLREENSFIRWALDSGLTVFMVSWVNPDKQHADKTLSDYILEGVYAAALCVCEITGAKQINALGYCAGGIALTCLVAYLTQKDRNLIKSATVIASPIDTRESGELLVYICEQQLKKLDEHMYKKGYLSGKAMAMSFNMLRANDLIWSFYINNYLLGRQPLPFDMLYWNNDSTRMPARMHSEYLRQIFLENRLIKKGKRGIRIKKEYLDLSKITVPLFLFGTTDDHIVPWRSVYPLARLVSGPVQFVLGGSGHVAGVFNSPNREKYGYWTNAALPKNPQHWLQDAEQKDGSWWPQWRHWLTAYCGDIVKPLSPEKKRILEDAPGSYAHVMGE